MSIQKVLTFACALALLGSISNCGSKSKQPTTTPAAPNTPSVDLTTPESAPSAQTFSERDIPGKTFSIDGASVTARAIITTGENRRAVFNDAHTVTYASRRASLERWQVFEADLEKRVEKRVSFDAGDAEPVASIGLRLVIASSSDEKKSGDRVLNRYQDVFSANDATVHLADSPLLHLMLEHPARGRKGTEWNRISHNPAARWSFSVDHETKQGLAVLTTGGTSQAFRVSINTKSREPETRVWTEIKVETPVAKENSLVSEGYIFPDGKLALWTNGKQIWTTNMKGSEPTRIGDDSTPPGKGLTIDPTGQWIVFSAAGPAKGLNLMALHKSGRCLKVLTELIGDESEPTFSPDGQFVFFTYSDDSLKQGHSSVIAKIPFGSSAAAAAACP